MSATMTGFGEAAEETTLLEIEVGDYELTREEYDLAKAVSVWLESHPYA